MPRLLCPRDSLVQIGILNIQGEFLYLSMNQFIGGQICKIIILIKQLLLENNNIIYHNVRIFLLLWQSDGTYYENYIIDQIINISRRIGKSVIKTDY